MNDYIIMAIAASICGVYGLLSMRISSAIQPLRLRFVDRVNELCENPNISDRAKSELQRLAEHMFDRRIAWVIVFTYPVGVYFALTGRGQADADVAKTDRARNAVASTISMGFFCAIASSPLALLIFIVQIALLLMLFAPLGAATRATLDVMFRNGHQHDGASSQPGC